MSTWDHRASEAYDEYHELALDIEGRTPFTEKDCLLFLAALGVPAATLAGLRSGDLVAFPRRLTRPIRLAFHTAHEQIEDGSAYPEGSPDYEWEAMLATATKEEASGIPAPAPKGGEGD